MDITTVARQVDSLFVMVVLLLVVNIGWSLFLVRVGHRLEALEVITGKPHLTKQNTGV